MILLNNEDDVDVITDLTNIANLEQLRLRCLAGITPSAFERKVGYLSIIDTKSFSMRMSRLACHACAPVTHCAAASHFSA